MASKIQTRRLELASVALLSLASATSATPACAADSASEQSNEVSNNGGLQEIVVTAQHREENLRLVPIAINAVSADTLQNAGVSDTSTLVQAVPSLNFTRSGPSGIFVIRGVATPNGAAGEEGSTAVYVDDVYMPDLASTINNFNNIERIEVLNGPQGTLFGRNATGGLIRVITKDPSTDHAKLEGQMGYGNYEMFSGQLYASTPLGDKAAMDIAFTGQSQGKGLGYDATLGTDVRKDNHWGVRSKLVMHPTDSLKVTLAGDYYRTDDDTALYIFPIVVATTPLTVFPTTAVGPISGQDSLAGYPSGTHIKAWGVNAKVELDTGLGALSSITSYRKLDNHSSFDIDGRAADLFHLFYQSGSRTFQQEIRLTSKTTEPLSWQVGAFYLHGLSLQDQSQSGAALANNTSRIVVRSVTDSIAGFGEVTYAVTPSTHITAGGRYTSDHRKLPIGYIATLDPTGTLVPPTLAKPNPVYTTNAPITFNSFTFRGAIRQDLGDSASAYVSVNKGFKAGEFYGQDPTKPAVKPETIMAYEAGFKGDFLDRHLRLSAAVYHYDIKDYQVRATVGVVSTLSNAAKVKIDGIDINAEAAVTSQLHLTAGATWLKARYAQFGGPGTGVLAPGTYPASDPGDATGHMTALAPHFTFNIGGTYTVPLGDARELRLTATMTHKSSYVFEPDNVLRQPAYTVGNLSVEYKLNEHIAFEGWMKNIGNRNYNVQMVTAVGQDALAAQPRMYGLNFKFNY